MVRSCLLGCCFALLESAASGQSPDVGILYYNVDPISTFTADFSYNFEAGQQIVLRICFANTGLGNAAGMGYSIALPTGLSGVSVMSTEALPTSGSYNSGTGILTLNNLPDPLPANEQLCGAGPYYFYFSRVVVSFTAPNSNFTAVPTITTATPQSPNTLPDSITGHFLVSHGPPTLIDLSILVEGPVPVPPGVPVEYGVLAQNFGPLTAQNAVVSVQLPVGTTGVAVVGGTYDPASGLVSWPPLQTFAVGGQPQFAFSIVNPPSAQGVASIHSANAETNYLNNFAAFNLRPVQAAAAVPGPSSRLLAALALSLLIIGFARLRARQKSDANRGPASVSRDRKRRSIIAGF